MDRQKTFDTVATHLITQGAQAMETEECRYRTSDGKRCAVGCLIPDELYSPKFEGKNAWAMLDMDQKLRAHIGIETNADYDFLGELQRIHDGNLPDAWAGLLRFLASLHSLAIPTALQQAA